MLPFFIDDMCLRRILPSATRLAVSDVEVIAQLAFLTGAIDFDENEDERELLEAINRNLWHILGAEPQPVIPISPLPGDGEERAAWLRELVPQLTTRDARELAYATCYLTVVIDCELSPVESDLLDELQDALEITDERAAEIAEAAAWALTELDQEPTPAEPSAPAARS